MLCLSTPDLPLESVVCWQTSPPTRPEGKVSGPSSSHSNLLFPPFCPSTVIYSCCIKYSKHTRGIRVGTTIWKRNSRSSATSHTQARGETDLPLITDPLVTIIKLLISNALRLSLGLRRLCLTAALLQLIMAADIFLSERRTA